MERTPAPAETPYRVLAYLLMAALVISTGLNFYLLGGSGAASLSVARADADDLAAVETELLHTQTLLARCRGSQAIDSLVVDPAQQASLFPTNGIK